MFKIKAQEVRELFQTEVSRLKRDYDVMEARVKEYEERIKTLTSVNIRQERTLVEVNQYFHHYIRARKSYAQTKELARAQLGDLLRNKYTSLQNKNYLHPMLDFYGVGLRLQAHERKKLYRDEVLRAMEKDVMDNNEKVEAIQAQLDSL
jgi:hypothetical protein